MSEKHESLDRNQESGPINRSIIITKIPKKIKILHREYDLLEYTKVETLREGNWGEADSNLGVLKYVPATQSSETADTLLHETMHAIVRMMGITLPKDSEEDIVKRLSTGLITVFKDNPKFTDALVALIKS